jgi:hypothetical protein
MKGQEGYLTADICSHVMSVLPGRCDICNKDWLNLDQLGINDIN